MYFKDLLFKSLFVMLFTCFITTSVDAQLQTARANVMTNSIKVVLTYAVTPDPEPTKDDFKIKKDRPLPADATLIQRTGQPEKWELTFPGTTNLADVNPFKPRGYRQATLVNITIVDLVSSEDPTSEVTINANNIVIVLTYRTAPNTDLLKSDFKINGGYPLPANATLTKNAAGTVWTLTFPGITDLAAVNPFRLKGYLQATLKEETYVDVEKPDASKILPAGGYAVIATYTNAEGGRYNTDPNANVPANDNTKFPTFPTDVGIRRDWDDHYKKDVAEDEMPDLYALFQENGKRATIDLIVRKPSALLDPARPLTHPDNRYGPANSRIVVINEIMWARDLSQIGEGTQNLREQWIEIYNASDDFVLFSDIVFTVNEIEFPVDPISGENGPTDRVSNLYSFDLTWEVDNKGQHGNPGSVEFVSMYRRKIEADDALGWLGPNWARSTNLFRPNYRGTPGKTNAVSQPPSARVRPSRDVPPKNKIVINEIGNLSGQADWIELLNNSGSSQSLNGWTLSIVTTLNNEQEIVRFPNISIPSGDVLLLVNADPIDTLFAAGYDASITDTLSQTRGADTNVRYLVVKDEKNHNFTGIPIAIPNSDNWLLILRSGQPWLPKQHNKDLYNTGHKIEDVAGPAAFEWKTFNDRFVEYEKKDDGSPGGEGPVGDIWDTVLFPLNGRTDKPEELLKHERGSQFGTGTVHARDASKQGFAKDSFTTPPFTGIGYDRGVQNTPANAGTPGYPNTAFESEIINLEGGGLIMSELMLTTDGRFPQWIELHNTSPSKGIRFGDPDGDGSLIPWKITFENHDSGSWAERIRPLNIEINLSDWFSYIPPNQTVLITSFSSRSSSSKHFPTSRIADVYQTKRKEFDMEDRRDLILNAAGGFYIKITDSSGSVSDEIGNLDGLAPNRRAGIGYDDPVGFEFPTELTTDGYRSSLIRLKNIDGTYRVAIPTRDQSGAATDAVGAVVPLGKQGKWRDYIDHAWTHTANTKRSSVQDTWYGSNTDISTPLHTSGTPLPVTLSYFRPVLENGQVVIRWTTESELDNAGFNLLRSPTRNGTFKQVNTALIRGAGTTGERHIYKWIDTTAKPEATYYYQIEDVSFAGEKQTLTTTKLKGLISAKNKLTTQWGELKGQK